MKKDTYLPTCVEDCSMAHKIDHCSTEWDLLKAGELFTTALSC